METKKQTEAQTPIQRAIDELKKQCEARGVNLEEWGVRVRE